MLVTLGGEGPSAFLQGPPRLTCCPAWGGSRGAQEQQLLQLTGAGTLPAASLAVALQKPRGLVSLAGCEDQPNLSAAPGVGAVSAQETGGKGDPE